MTKEQEKLKKAWVKAHLETAKEYEENTHRCTVDYCKLCITVRCNDGSCNLCSQSIFSGMVGCKDRHLEAKPSFYVKNTIPYIEYHKEVAKLIKDSDRPFNKDNTFTATMGKKIKLLDKTIYEKYNQK